MINMATTTPPIPVSEAITYKQRTLRGMAWQQFRHHQMAMAGSLILGLLIFGAIFISVISPYSATDSSLR